tara:strand:- start:490 stop:690 length:201 start_codon:yes stop_codon:yes gene_type:complete
MTEEIEYVYFVSYSHTRGSGNTEMTQDFPFTSMRQIKETQALIEKNGTAIGVVILSFQLLSTNKKG